VLTLDLALHCGWALLARGCPLHRAQPLVIECGMLRLTAHETRRFTNLAVQFEELLDLHRPALVLIEQNFVFRNVRSTAALNQLQGLIRYLCATAYGGLGVDVAMVDNNTSKKFVLGSTQYWNGEAYVGVTKDMLETGVRAVLCGDCVLPAVGDHDAFDAIAIGLAYYDAPLVPAALARRPIPPKAPKTPRLTRVAGTHKGVSRGL